MRCRSQTEMLYWYFFMAQTPISTIRICLRVCLHTTGCPPSCGSMQDISWKRCRFDRTLEGCSNPICGFYHKWKDNIVVLSDHGPNPSQRSDGPSRSRSPLRLSKGCFATDATKRNRLGRNVSWIEPQVTDTTPVPSRHAFAAWTKDILWHHEPSENVECESCASRVTQNAGTLGGEPYLSRFSQQVFFCMPCISSVSLWCEFCNLTNWSYTDSQIECNLLCR